MWPTDKDINKNILWVTETQSFDISNPYLLSAFVPAQARDRVAEALSWLEFLEIKYFLDRVINNKY